MKIEVKTDISAFKARMASIPDKLSKRILQKAVNAACQPILKDYRSLITQRTGALKKMITKKVKRVGDKAIGIIGPKKDMVGEVRPARYSHLLEWGVKPHMIGGRMHPGFGGRLFLTKATNQNEAKAQKIMADKVTEELNTL